ncbi:N-acetylglucosamine-6-phosphate deacetylase [Alicyclobacillus fodiniaquatilis]|uniref:N-acetylglucosamine-6-phosphate deacetylase n=1 Tax=Alicyclobacillus fodiniaquatilis TaxID=1661150 RepID=A0ABW4JJ02_9BACL
MSAMSTGSMVIRGARVVTPYGVIEDGWVKVENGVVSAVAQSAEALAVADEVIDANGAWLVPGFIDIHVHGGNGADVMDGQASSIRTIGQFHAKHGTTSWLPTTLTAPVDHLAKSIASVDTVRNEGYLGATILGLHLEGPFIDMERRGAQNPDYVLEPNLDVMKRLANVAPGLIRKVTIAPERPDALRVIRWLSENGIISSMGHTNATMAEIQAGVEAGATHATHLFNGMRGLHHREGGAVGGCLLSDAVVCELIADGHHVQPEVMKLVVKTKGPGKVVLITDAMTAAGQPDGHYRLGGLDVTVTDGVALLTEGHNLAGSTLTMNNAVKTMVSRVGVDMLAAVQMASDTPARELGVSDRKGGIEVGKDADLVLLDESLQVMRTIIGGNTVYAR